MLISHLEYKLEALRNTQKLEIILLLIGIHTNIKQKLKHEYQEVKYQSKNLHKYNNFTRRTLNNKKIKSELGNEYTRKEMENSMIMCMKKMYN